MKIGDIVSTPDDQVKKYYRNELKLVYSLK